MEYLPGRCDACGFVVLIAHGAGSPHRGCPKCDADVSVFPGAKHREDERGAFETLSQRVHDSVAPGEAARVLSEFEELGDVEPTSMPTWLVSRLPALSQTIAALALRLPTQSIGTMLITLLRARSSVRTRSGFLSLSGDSYPDASEVSKGRLA
jgi:hypothetical protein